jgi:hypothetical protein
MMNTSSKESSRFTYDEVSGVIDSKSGREAMLACMKVAEPNHGNTHEIFISSLISGFEPFCEAARSAIDVRHVAQDCIGCGCSPSGGELTLWATVQSLA